MAMAATSISSLPELSTTIATLQLARINLLKASNWTHESSTQLPGFVASLAFRDCDKLYDESETRLSRLVSAEITYTADDALTWLSGVLANHRTCLEGLAEKGLVEGPQLAQYFVHSQKLKASLGEALASYSNKKETSKGKRLITRRPGQKSNPSTNGGVLVSWNPATSKADFVVAKDGSGTHKTINDAVAALASMGHGQTQRAIIYVKSGVYNEKVEIEGNLRNVMFVGDGMSKTIVTGNRNVPDGATTLSSATFGISGDGFWARDITFENTAGPQKHQAVALRVSSDQAVFYRCGIRGYQDTLYAHSLRQFYRDCHIYGTIDFIFGDAPAVLQNCDIFVRRPMAHQANMITAQGRDNPNENTGLSFHNSRVRAAHEFESVKSSFSTYLGRPWKKYSRTVFLKTDLDGLVDPKGWTEWRGNFAVKTLFYGEYMNTGRGASTARRVSWPGFHVLISPQQASPFTVGSFIQGRSWIPDTGVPFTLGI
ncbi:Pectinesterase inhibitor domain containing protein [Parasponia andersonii]|uniref:Pectinesterase n=1 Tax=Parasponia andersonii TaxID=3476 RepID=A0A2P5BER0_PARAD|nr:Pectinesterase inhibitor domain containing protein [Parasponia andersonii]